LLEQRAVRALAHVAAGVVGEPHVVRARAAQQLGEAREVDVGAQLAAQVDARSGAAGVVDARGVEAAARAALEAEVAFALHSQTQEQHRARVRKPLDESCDCDRCTFERDGQLGGAHAQPARRTSLQSERDRAAGILGVAGERSEPGDQDQRSHRPDKLRRARGACDLAQGRG
jgi:hypothetical protein